ncbi:MAG TPA: O-antigen ligase family protein, partial [Thermoanaerobaculia bacterium]
RFTQDYVERAQTISDYQEDRSAMGRLNAWQTSWGVFLDYPVFGVGPNNLEVVYRAYSPEPDRFRVSHNAFLQILCECGLPALVLFLAVIASGLWSLRRTQRAAERDSWVEVYARMLQISLLAYLIGSMFLSTAYSELLYQIIAMSVCLEVIARVEAGDEAVAPAPVAMAPWWKQPLATAVARRA